MIDIEALGKNYGSILFELGACAFDKFSGEVSSSFEAYIDIEDAKTHGLTTDQSTLDWWESQGGFSQHPNAAPHKKAMKAFVEWVEAQEFEEIWVWGMDYDLPIIKRCLEVVEIAIPWKYWMARDGRTLWNIAFPDEKLDKKPHSAIEDSIIQVDLVHRATVELEKRKNAKS